MITKIVRISGIFLIVAFCALSVFLSTAEREIDDPNLRRIFSFPSLFEDRFFDFRMNMTLDREAVDKRLVLAAIDNKSLKEIGRWPWPRKVWTEVVKKLGTFGAKVLAFDVFFSEPEIACNTKSPDIMLAEAFKEFESTPGNKVVLPYSLNTSDSEFFDEIPEVLYNFIMDTRQAQGYNLSENFISKTVFPLSQFTDAGVSIGHIEAEADADGIFRHYPLIANVQTLYFPSYSLLAYQLYTKDRPVLQILNIAETNLKLKNGAMDLNFKGEAKIRWLGDSRSFPTVSIYDILKAPDDDPSMAKIFNGTITFLGSTAFGAHDLRHTPVDPMLPGVYFHMNMTHMLLEGKFFKSKNDATLISWGLLIGGTLIMILIHLFGNAIMDAIVVTLLGGSMFLFDAYFLTPMGYEVKLFFALLSIISCYSFTTVLNFYLSNKDKKFLKQAFGNYISPELIDMMYESGEAPKLGGDCDTLTAYFTDIQSFSTFSEKLSATGLVELLNEYLTAMTDILLEEGGTLDKYEGDAIIAFFGAPMKMEDHATRACRVAHRMQERLAELREKWSSEGEKWPVVVQKMRMRIGINSGEIVTGNMGSKSRMNYTMMGDSVNLAARLEEAAKQYGIFTQVSHFTKELIEDIFEMRELDTIKVVGKSEPVTTFDLLGMKGEADDDIIKLKELFHEGLANYKNQQWDQALASFEKSLELEYKRFGLKDKPNPSKIYIDRCNQFKDNPPAKDWDGVYTLTSK